VPVSVASAIAPEVREYERIATTVANAFLEPRVRRYLGTLARAHRGPFEVVLSHGGTAPPHAAAREPVRQLLSGPAAGLRAALAAARACGFETALTLDVGGTSTDCALLGGEDAGADGLPRSRRREVAGVPVLLPALDVHTVGAGGGSVARVDAQGLLQVGPESAGADPGPACYGRGGPATVTDALLLLGRLPLAALAGGALPLDPAAAAQALAGIARGLGIGDARAAAEAVVTLADAHMEGALRRVSVARGEDPQRAALVAFGGAGGLHACALAEALAMRAVVWPRHAGVLCALGALTGGARRERSRSVLCPVGAGTRLARVLAALTREVAAGFAPRQRTRVRHEAWAEVRYRGQAHELSLPAAPLATLAERFHAAHARRYGFAESERAVEVVTLEVRGALPRRAAADPLPPRRPRRPAPRVAVWQDGRSGQARVHSRAELAAGTVLHGPAVVCDAGATLWLAPGWRAVVHASGALVARRGSRR
jgi:N-methylhydantoinase A